MVLIRGTMLGSRDGSVIWRSAVSSMIVTPERKTFVFEQLDCDQRSCVETTGGVVENRSNFILHLVSSILGTNRARADT